MQTQGHRGTAVLMDCNQLTFSRRFHQSGNLCKWAGCRHTWTMSACNGCWWYPVLISHTIVCCYTPNTAKLHCVCASGTLDPG